MAKEANITEIVQTLQEAQQNKDFLSALTTSLDRYVAGQKKGLAELESLIAQAKAGKLTVKQKAVYRSRKSKTANEGE